MSKEWVAPVEKKKKKKKSSWAHENKFRNLQTPHSIALIILQCMVNEHVFMNLVTFNQNFSPC